MRRFARLLCLLAVVSAPLLASQAAQAQSEDAQVAARLAVEAKGLIDEGRCEEALPKLDASLTIYAHPKVKFLKARCLYELDRDLDEARALLESVKGDPALEQYGSELPDLLLAIEERLRPVPIVVTVEGGGHGAVEIDGVLVGDAPYRGNVTRGRHDVLVTGPGCDEAPRGVEAAGDGPILVTVRCVPPRDGTLEVRAPEGVLVSLDEVPQGRTPLAKPLRASAGTHTLTFERGSDPPALRQVTLTPGQRLVVDWTPRESGDGGGSSAWAWTTLAGGVALVGVGTGFLVQHGIDLADQREEIPGVYTGDSVSSTNAIVGGVALGAGVGLVVTSFFLWPDDDETALREDHPGRPGRTPVGLSLGAAPGGATFTWSSRF